MPKRKLKTNRIAIFACVIVCSQLFACQYQTNNEEIAHVAVNEAKTLSAITLSNGQKVTNCIHYNSARLTYTVSETINNSIIANEYLSCSLNNTNTIEANEAKEVAKQLMTLRVRQLSLSIAQMFGRKSTLLEAGFIQKQTKLVWSAKQHNVNVQVKAKAEGLNSKYLIWVSDVISDGNYYAYYPAWVELATETSTIKVYPVYQSGY